MRKDWNIRVFPYRTSYTPDDEWTFIGEPPMLFGLPEHDNVYISCTFTWDKKQCEYLQEQWQAVTDKPVHIGGVAYGSPTDEFIQGMFLKPNIIFTTRGCNNNCKWCCVPKTEGKLRELPIVRGNIIQDNNFLQASTEHKDNVFEMLKSQRNICFKGGLEPQLIDDHFINGISKLRISELWLACDTDGALKQFETAMNRLKKAGYNHNKVYSYVLIGDDIQKNESRLKEVYQLGAMPFAQLYRDFSETKTQYCQEWRDFARRWQRPAIIKSMMKGADHD